jgi:positive regulator of sigma E activity
MHMEELVIFRIFLTFPLVGLLIPKAGIIFAGAKGYISAADVIIAITLIISIIICSIGILLHQRKLTAIKSNEPVISWDV